MRLKRFKLVINRIPYGCTVDYVGAFTVRYIFNGKRRARFLYQDQAGLWRKTYGKAE